MLGLGATGFRCVNFGLSVGVSAAMGNMLFRPWGLSVSTLLTLLPLNLKTALFC